MDNEIAGNLQETTGRDERGRFLKGVSGNPKGRARRSTEEAYLSAIFSGVPTRAVTEGARKLAIKLKNGDIAAWKLLLPYLAGLPIQRNEHTGEDGDPLRILVEYAANSENSELNEPHNYD